ncbi:MAG: preprotein translocase subunit SecG [Muribaculaceae bacterium]|nr:preprotein translocase subunit SecG [Muribaculaceae bacterium]MDE5972175.1 preprotein translocase subunit SecG [Muribaculaceae bacterium]MDE6462580.1 preprotein translocase subunit SecG [Muribaculaceae bacterium]MDE6508662.1 preprotein translocase subunit SecG [Muribaculaceae bacterium]
MHTIVIVLTIIVAILLIGIVLIQKSKGGGLSSQFAGTNQIMGVRRTNDVVEKVTWWLAGLVALLSIVSVFTAPSLTRGTEVRTTMETAMPADIDLNSPAPAAVSDAPAAAEEAAPAEQAQ